jgi:hypothetical protein
MFRKKILVNYVSDVDKFSIKFDKAHALSASQLAEINKYKRIKQLRDEPFAENPAPAIWEEF